MIAGKVANRLALLERARRAAGDDASETCDCVLRIRVVYDAMDAPIPMQPPAPTHCRHGRPWARVAVLSADTEGEDDE